ncbi:MAG: hypothetical protein OEQ28_01225 [Acidobacteriota bacterium]|nr:hypothetical protein [Acidobacteriota bacterium]
MLQSIHAKRVAVAIHDGSRYVFLISAASPVSGDSRAENHPLTGGHFGASRGGNPLLTDVEKRYSNLPVFELFL